MDNLGIWDRLRDFKGIKDAHVLEILKEFEEQTNAFVHSERFQIDIHKNRIKMQANHIAVLESRIETYMEQQSLFNMMKFDLEKYNTAF